MGWEKRCHVVMLGWGSPQHLALYEYCSIHSLVNAITRQELNVEVLTHTSQLCVRHHHLQMS